MRNQSTFNISQFFCLDSGSTETKRNTTRQDHHIQILVLELFIQSFKFKFRQRYFLTRLRRATFNQLEVSSVRGKMGFQCLMGQRPQWRDTKSSITCEIRCFFSINTFQNHFILYAVFSLGSNEAFCIVHRPITNTHSKQRHINKL